MSTTSLAIAGLSAVALFSLGGCRHDTELSGFSRGPGEIRLDPIQGMERALTAKAPKVPQAIVRDYATRVELDLEIREHTKTLADGVNYTYWTFGDDCPGPFIRVREGDLVETHLSNHPDNSVSHNISFQGASAPEGGGDASLVEPGHSATFTWRAMHPGLYLYRSVSPPAGLQVANGMYGLILVQSRTELPKVDREYYVVQSEFYTEGKFGERGTQGFSLDKAMRSEPEYVVFNGHVGALSGPGALETHVGERVRLYVANAGPNLPSSFHIQGVIFDAVYSDGGGVASGHNAQSVDIPPGSSAIVEFTAQVPGEYALVDNSIFRASNRGAAGSMRVVGRPNDLIFTGKIRDEPYDPGTHLERLLTASEASSGKQLTFAEMMTQGAQVYGSVCFACHQSDGAGLPGKFPPLAHSDFLMADRDRAVAILLNGRKGPITVNGAKFDGEMPKLPLTIEQIASALTYVRNSFGNKGSAVTVADVTRVRTDTSSERLEAFAQTR